MNSVLALLLVGLVCVLAQDTLDAFGQTKSWTGDLSLTTQTFAPPNNEATCAARTAQYRYASVNFNFTTAGTRQIGVMAQNAFKPFIQVYIYSGSFNPASPCTNLVRLLTNANLNDYSGVLTFNDPYFFSAATTYTFVITSSSNTGAGSYGAFAVSIFGSLTVGTTVGQPTWTPAQASNTAPYCASYPTLGAQNVQVYTWTQTTTAQFDILVLFANTGLTPSQITSNVVSFAIYQGTFSAADLAANNCPPGGSPSTIKISATEGDLMAVIKGYGLTQDVTYTIAVSCTTAGNFGIQVIPTRVSLRGAGSYAQPNRLPITPCASNSSAATAGYVAPAPITAAANYDYHFVDTYGFYTFDTVQTFDQTAFLYQGSVTPQSGNIAACPTGATFLGAQNIGCSGNCGAGAIVSGGPVFAPTVAGTTYSVVISTRDGSSLATPPTSPTGAQWGAQVFVLAGPSITPTTTTTTTTSTSGLTSTTTSNSTTSTGVATSGTSTTTTSGAGTSTTRTSTSTTSGAASLAISSLFLLAAILALF